MMKINESTDSKKLRGGYYTPEIITDFICKWAINKHTDSVLEPSCGDGNFIESAIRRLAYLGSDKVSISRQLKGVELNSTEARKAKETAQEHGISSKIIHIGDFFEFLKDKNNSEPYDVIIGNPPFIRYQNFPTIHRELAFEQMNNVGMKPNKLTNIWVPFLVLSSFELKENGRLGMVIPAELFQVKYAAETRLFLSKFFSNVIIVTFKKLVFADIQQEVVILLCSKKKGTSTSIKVAELDGLSELKSWKANAVASIPTKTLEHTSEKWIKYFLDENEIQLLREIKSDNRLQTCGDYMQVDVGLVTGRNEFFMMTERDVRKWKLKNFTQPVVSKSAHFKGIEFTLDDEKENSDGQVAAHLFIPPNKDFADLPAVCQDYIRFGEERNYNDGYKCRIRKRWYITPSLWTPDGFALRQVGDYPKIISNRTSASSTDTIHRIRNLSQIDIDVLSLSFLNSLSFAFSEILGRSYGGGVLTFEPTEIEEIPLPVLLQTQVDRQEIDKLIRERRILEVLTLVDKQLLIKQLGYSQKDVTSLRSIWAKLANRRKYRKTRANLESTY